MQSSLRCSGKTNNKKRRRRFLFIFGTRPEAIKLAPLVSKMSEAGSVKVCVTGQHRAMLDQVLGFFSVVPDFDLKVMTRDQGLFGVTARVLRLLEPVFEECRPDLAFVQGDTTTAFAGALSAFYSRVPVAHVEAGLRSFRKDSPFPEEMNRVLAGHLADFHFAPTETARQNLIRESIPSERIFVVGNTVIDALFEGLRIVRGNEEKYRRPFGFLDPARRVILVTGHRRESFGRPFVNICRALRDIARQDVEIVYPVHLNPRVRTQVYPILKDVRNIHLMEPLEYPYLIWLMNRSFFVLTDSGGIQEEAPSLGKPVLVMREVTERVEGIEAGTARLVGTNRNGIVASANELLNDPAAYRKMARAVNPYGDGRASNRISRIVRKIFR